MLCRDGTRVQPYLKSRLGTCLIEVKKAKKMKLSDYGISDESNLPNLELTEGKIGSEYRSTTGRQKYLRHIPVPHSKIDLKYHGVVCSVDDQVDVAVTELGKNNDKVAASTIATTTEVVLNKSSRQQVLEELHNTHLNNIRRNLEYRLQVARAKGDQNLINLLELEAQQLA